MLAIGDSHAGAILYEVELGWVVEPARVLDIELRAGNAEDYLIRLAYGQVQTLGDGPLDMRRPVPEIQQRGTTPVACKGQEQGATKS